jgi:hypothetical protein
MLCNCVGQLSLLYCFIHYRLLDNINTAIATKGAELPLHEAGRQLYAALQRVKELPAEARQQLLEQRSTDDRITPLHAAAALDLRTAARWLMAGGLGVNSKGFNPLTYALSSYYCSGPMARLLLDEGSTIGVSGEFTALDWCVAQAGTMQKVAAAKELLAKKPELATAIRRGGNNAAAWLINNAELQRHPATAYGHTLRQLNTSPLQRTPQGAPRHTAIPQIDTQH